jgi:nitroimidazol reductase NimA-like FMN-containing flavoprotein (pyridoxamine 5'-phosphate oxidase superfamily)
VKKEQLEAIIRKATVCRLGMLDGDSPYIVPLCFGYRNDTLYFHGSPKSRKLDLIRAHPRVCFEFDILTEPLPAQDPCKWNMRYQSVVGFGQASVVEAIENKRTALEIIAQQYAGAPVEVPEKKIAMTAVFKVTIEKMTGRSSGLDT